MNSAIADAFRRQIIIELDSCYLYLQMALWLQEQALPGCANWMRKQAHEEVGHALILYCRLASRKANVEIGKISPPKREFATLEGCFAQFLEHEARVEESIEHILRLARHCRDDGAANLLEWFEAESAAREEEVDEILKRLKITNGKRGPALLDLDESLAEREFRLPEPLRKGA
ncbi:MAG: ferritin [Planctomycetota bacterium]|jgi:ferritin|nr:ferritin [Planctomycetota bacterium]